MEKGWGLFQLLIMLLLNYMIKCMSYFLWFSSIQSASSEAEPAAYEEGEDEEEKREIGKLAVWTVTSAKPGNGVELMRDDNLETYWQ